MKVTRRVRSPWFIGSAVVFVALLAVVVFYFEPQAAFFDDKVADAVPAGATLTESTAFVSLEHETSGALAIATTPDGARYVRIEALDTLGGPDLHVYLSSNGLDGSRGDFDDEFVDLGELRGNIGDQNYMIDASVDFTQYRTVVIWCVRFDAAFGAAPLPT